MIEKTCYSCEETKPGSAFNKASDRHFGLADHCRDCYHASRARKRLETPERYWVANAIVSHRAAGYEIKFRREWLLQMALDTRHCLYCGTEINWRSEGRGPRADCPSLDRINNQSILTEDDVEIICHRCNSAKGVETKEQYLAWLRRSAVYQGARF